MIGFSISEELKGKLDYYIKTRLPENVKLIRLSERNGLIKARLAGARAASGDVLVFLDSHCECVVGWLVSQGMGLITFLSNFRIEYVHYSMFECTIAG